jgi:undecaprenyl diphosphate synthase
MQIPTEDMPQHIAIIMDGNRRWARSKGLPVLLGHQKGVEVAEAIVRKASDIGLKYLTLYTFSSENWERPFPEVKGLMKILEYYFKKRIQEIHKNNVKLHIIGDYSKFSPPLQKLFQSAIALMENNTGLNLVLALNYGSRQEILQAVCSISQKVLEGEMKLDELNEETISHHLYTKNIPDPDLFIRTSGEQRISNYLLWQMAYTEMLFLETFWPDFSPEILEEAIHHYTLRDRRYGR